MHGGVIKAIERSARQKQLLHLRRLCKTPKRIVLIRHGESAANVDEAIYTKTADWVIPLTGKGQGQAHAAGVKLREIIKNEPLCAIDAVGAAGSRNRCAAERLQAQPLRHGVRWNLGPLRRGSRQRLRRQLLLWRRRHFSSSAL